MSTASLCRSDSYDCVRGEDRVPTKLLRVKALARVFGVLCPSRTAHSRGRLLCSGQPRGAHDRMGDVRTVGRADVGRVLSELGRRNEPGRDLAHRRFDDGDVLVHRAAADSDAGDYLVFAGERDAAAHR
jgi:hypothetical protein